MNHDRSALTEVHPGIFRLCVASTNCYLVQTDEGLTLVDSGLPRMWPILVAVLGELGAGPEDLDAVVLTHAHFDHIGMSRRLNDDHAVPTFVHPADRAIAAHPYGYKPEVSRVAYMARHPRGWGVLARMAAAGAMNVRGVDAAPTLSPGAGADVPGAPTVVASPGHTNGHVSLYLPESGVLFTGDALVTLDPYSGRTGPRIVAPAATHDTAQALRSLDALGDLEARLVLPGHGEPWREGGAEAVRRAKTASQE